MKSKARAKPPARRHIRKLAPTRAWSVADHFEELASRFSAAAVSLPSGQSLRTSVATIRDAMESAGKLLMEIVDPSSLPDRRYPWKAISRRRHKPDLRFAQIKAKYAISGTPMPLDQLVLLLGSERKDLATIRSDADTAKYVASFVSQHFFLEALSTWLGDLCSPRIDLVTARFQAWMISKSAKKPVALNAVFDRHSIQGDEAGETFVRFASAGAAACRHLAELLRLQAPSRRGQEGVLGEMEVTGAAAAAVVTKANSRPVVAGSTLRAVSRKAKFEDVLGSQDRTRLRRLAVLKALPADSNKSIVGQLDEYGQDGPDDSTVCKDLKAMRAAGAVHRTKLDLTEKGKRILKQLPN